MSTKTNQNQNHKTNNSNLNDNDFFNENYIHYIYKITNLLNNKYYIGIHSVRKGEFEDLREDGYWGSGNNIKKAIREDGKENFKKEILKIFSTREEAMEEESRMVTMREVNDPNCYNMMIGGVNGRGTTGFILARAKNNLEKVIKITKDEFYNNKDLYIAAGCLSFYFKYKDMTPEEKEKYKKELRRKGEKKRFLKKKEETNGKFGHRKKLLNKNTLEIKEFYPEEITGLYDIWFPQYFLDKTNNKFISEEYLIEKLNLTQSKAKLCKEFQTSNHSLHAIIDYYISIDKSFVEKLRDKNGNPVKEVYDSRFGSKNKTIMNKDGVTRAIYKSEVEKYLDLGWELGKPIPISREELIDYCIEGHSLVDCNEHFKIAHRRLKKLIGENAKFMDFYKGNKTVRLFVDDEIYNRLIENGWKRGHLKSLNNVEIKEP